MKITIHCSQCPWEDQTEATFENERITAYMPRKWSYVCFEVVLGKENMDVLLCPACTKIQKTKWGDPPPPKKRSRVKKKK